MQDIRSSWQVPAAGTFQVTATSVPDSTSPLSIYVNRVRKIGPVGPPAVNLSGRLDLTPGDLVESTGLLTAERVEESEG